MQTLETTNDWPTHEWRTSTPEEQGMDSELLVKMFDTILEKKLNLHSLLIVRNGIIVTEAYFHPFQVDTQHEIASCTKSFTSALVGIAIEKGYIDNTNHKVLDFFPERTIANNDARKQAITLEDLLTMTSGLEWKEDRAIFAGSSPIDQMRTHTDQVQFILDQPMSESPGIQWNYNSGGSHLLSAIIDKTTRSSTLAFAKAHLFDPLGIVHVTWPTDPSGINTGGGGIVITPRDMAKFGYLYLKKGVWDGQQIIPAGWIEVSTTRHIQTRANSYTHQDDYGYQWWIPTPDSYAAKGYGGQRIFVIPNQGLVIVFTAGINFPEIPLQDKLVESFILPAIKSTAPLPANPRAMAQLESHLLALAQPKPAPVQPLPATALNISGKTYALNANSLGLEAFSMNFTNGDAWLKVTLGGQTQQWAIGLDDVYRTTRVEPIGSLQGIAALKGSWEDANTFSLSVMLNGSTSRVIFRFVGEKGVMLQRIGLEGDREVIQGAFQG